ncbi:restriction endonuclease subunit S [Aliiroseovarius crassostreae]|uniref:restriction endonuclease subunit S n=1 Tax=Aliiroseovarius crassostreae TaxID=154981 RepID=UPI0021B02072|nr:restriction endonuclease subunit S [Aliiroseovarius crassostreae]UWQ11025.1 restriction endonuclease subunit S [Aliiroseovarius crassostreae]
MSRISRVPRLRFPEFRHSKGWDNKQLGDILSVGNGRDHKHLAEGDIPVYGSGGYMRSVNEYLYDGASACIGRKGTIDKPVFLTGKFWTVDTLFFTHSYEGSLPLFVYAIFQNINWLNHNEAGGVPSLSKANIEKISIDIPSLEEQQKIADCLTSIDDLITAEAEKLAALKDHKKGLMQQLFPRKGETTPRFRFPEFCDAGDWLTADLEQVASVSSGGTPSRGNPKYWGGDIPWVSTTLIDFNTITTANEFITKIGLEESSAKFFEKNTILMAMYGQGKTRGKVALLGIDAAINQACAAITVNKDMNADFVFQNLCSRYDEIRSISNQGGQENLSGAIVKKIPLSYPDPKSREQQKIADCLTSIDDLITAEVEKLTALKYHKKGLMQQLFPASNEVNG